MEKNKVLWEGNQMTVKDLKEILSNANDSDLIIVTAICGEALDVGKAHTFWHNAITFDPKY